MPEIKFTIPGEPVAKGRPKFVIRYKGKVPFVHVYTPKETESYEKYVCACAVTSGVLPAEPLDCCLVLSVVFVHERTQELLKTGRGGKYKYSTDRIKKPTKPDLTNLIKAIEDGINHSNLWVDDARIVESHNYKYWAAIGESPHVEVTVSWN
jgi:Holliday junction resolvase RusA-like endonuclease